MRPHLHLEPIGGLSGDMFLAAMLDAFPECEAPLRRDLEAMGIAPHAQLETTQGTSAGLAARQVSFRIAEDAPATRHWRDIRVFLEKGRAAEAVRERAIAIFSGLAEAEAQVHGVAVEDVHFHEIADWDSLADIIGAASVIEAVDAGAVTSAPVPLGSGRVQTAHGMMPVPAPAAAFLLSGFPVFSDDIAGERITPTGAAILKHLVRAPEAAPPPGRLAAIGTGMGQKNFDGFPNILRILSLETTAGQSRDRVHRIAFEIDDMTPEELAVALDRIRGEEAVLDAGFSLTVGKKGRPRFAVDVLTRNNAADAVADMCFRETSTLGLRVEDHDRRILPREAAMKDGVRVKRAERPGGATVKVENDDLAAIPGLAARRAAARKAEHD